MDKEQVKLVENAEPGKFDELSQRMRFTYLKKDPNKNLRNASLNCGTQWQAVQNLPEVSVRGIITNKVLEMDKNSC